MQSYTEIHVTFRGKSKTGRFRNLITHLNTIFMSTIRVPLHSTETHKNYWHQLADTIRKSKMEKIMKKSTLLCNRSSIT